MPDLLTEKATPGLNPRQAESAQVRQASPSRRRVITFTRGLLGLLILAAIWEITPRLELLNPIFVPPLSEDLKAMWRLIETGEMWKHLSASLVRSGAGFGLALATAIPLGTAIAWYTPVREVTTPVLEVFRNTAALALLPVFMLVFGIGETSKVAIVLFACFFPILLSTIGGVQNVDVQLLRAARVLGLSPVETFRKIVFPAAVPTIFTGIRISGAAAILATTIVGLFVNYGLVALERRFQRWRA